MKETDLIEWRGKYVYLCWYKSSKTSLILEKLLAKTILCVSTQYSDRKDKPKVNCIIMIKSEI